MATIAVSGRKFYLHRTMDDAGMKRKPTEIQTARIGPLARLPAFFALEGKRVVVVGSGQAAIWKAELLSAAGAHVDVFSPIRSDSLDALAAAPPVGAVIVHERRLDTSRFSRHVSRGRRMR